VEYEHEKVTTTILNPFTSMSYMHKVTRCLLSAAAAPHKGKITKNDLEFKRRENLLQNGMLHFAIR